MDMIPVHSHQGQFWAIRYLTTATEFKFSPNKDWNGAFKAQGANDSGFIAKGDNCAVEKEGLYMIFVDLEGECITVEPAAVFGMGDCFGNWDAGKNPFEMQTGGRWSSTSSTARSFTVQTVAIRQQLQQLPDRQLLLTSTPEQVASSNFCLLS